MIINILTGGSRIEWARGRVRTSITLQTLIRPNIDLWTGIMEATLCERELRNSSLKAFSSSGLKCRTIFAKIGYYYSTPIYKFRMKCAMCDQHFEIKTDPQNQDYVILSGARRKEQRWDATQNEQVGLNLLPLLSAPYSLLLASLLVSHPLISTPGFSSCFSPPARHP